MSQATLFHESWYRVADQRISLRPNVVIQRQMLRGERWHVVQNPLSNQFYRLNPGTYNFVSRLSSSRTVEDVWKEVQESDPENAPGQRDVVELLAQLYHANLLHYNLPPNSEKLFSRYKEKKQRILKANLKSIMFFRVPLFDPDALLQRLLPFIRLLIGPLGALVWCVVVAIGAKLAIDNFAALQVESEGFMAPSNLFLLYAGLVVVKTLHEFGHAFAVRRFGGEVHTMGVMFLIFSPLPYMDASSAWAFRNKWHRVFVGAAGMVFEVFVAACAMIVWANTGPGTIHSLAYNMVFIASVTTILFNINPLLRFDGYYILSDLMDMPNLHQHSSRHLKYLVEHHAFGCKNVDTPATNRREEIWFTTFGILAGIYRIFVFSVILLFVADQFLLAGIIMTAICLVSWVIVPISNAVKYLASSPRLYRTRARAIAVCSGVAVVVGALLFFVPFPNSFLAPGVIKSTDYVLASSRSAGQIAEIYAPSGSRVQPGDRLLRLENPELALEMRESQAGLDEAVAQHRKAMFGQQADLAPIEDRIAFYEKRLERLAQEQADLVMKAEIAGIWVAPDLEDRVGMWVGRGMPMGELINDDQFQFLSVVSQTDVSELFAQGIRHTEVKLIGQAETALRVADYATIPIAQTALPSVALGFAGGGDIAIDTRDDQGVTTSEPYYQVRAMVEASSDVSLLHGRSGQIRFSLEPQSLAWQGWRRFSQLLQERYQLI